jgi:class 3 adenylate cyclase/HAMP domain-containing protein
MPQILFSLEQPRLLILAIICTTITIYLLTQRDKTRDLRLLLGAFSCWSLYFLFGATRESVVYPATAWCPIVEFTVGLLGLVLLIGFAYSFLGEPYPSESRVVMAVAGTAVAGTSLILTYQMVVGKPLMWFIGSGIGLLLFLWAEIVFLRRRLRAANLREASAHRQFALVFLLPASAVGIYLLRDVGVFSAEATPLICTLLFLCTLVSFSLVYVNNAPRPTTFRVKIVGLSLSTMLGVLAVVSSALLPPSDRVSVRPGETLRFTPQREGRYRVDSIALNFDPALGERIKGSTGVLNAVTLDWPFRFYGRDWRAVSISSTGRVRFMDNPSSEAEVRAGLAPFVSPVTYLQPDNHLVYVKQQPKTITITWQSPQTAIQLVLHRDGTIDFVYHRPGRQLYLGQRGISPNEKIAFNKYLGRPLLTQKEGLVLLEDFEIRRRRPIQHSLWSTVHSIIGSTLFILIIFPRFFRVSLVDPLNELLQGVDKIERGSRDVQIPASFNDEVGKLTNSFNRMTVSLKAAEDELKSYAESLEEKVEERTLELARKNKENERLLLNILPASIAERLKHGEETIADVCSETTILFADIVGFTELSLSLSPTEIVELLSGLFSEFDSLAQKHGVEKIKTIGDAYMAVAGLPQARHDHAQATLRLALDMMEVAGKRKISGGRSLQLRIGINSGPVVAGVIGTHKFAYDLWGDAVNTASRMESHGQPGRIQVTEATYRLLREQYEFEARREVQVKGKGCMFTYLVGPNLAKAEISAN